MQISDKGIELNKDTELDKDVIVIVVTGGPCAGKTALIERVVELLQRHDFVVATLTETPTELERGNISPESKYLSAKDFQDRVIKWQILKENFWIESLNLKETQKQKVLICDRGVLDSRAYTDRETFNEIIEDLGVSPDGELLSRYDLVVHMTTAADGAEKHYTTENNTARTETPEEARQLDLATKKAWSEHRNHRVIDNRTGFTEKIMRALKAFERVLDTPDAREKERKHLVTDYQFAKDFVCEQNLSGIKIKQAYLEISDSVEKRVRRRESMNTGEVTYVFTKKHPTEDFGEREENSEDIDQSDFQRGVSQSNYVTMIKDRYYLYANGYRFVIDLIKEPVRRAYIEVELVSMEENPQPPEPLDKVTREVTEETEHKAAEIVRRNS